MIKGAIISECGKYRYRLWRIWDDAKPQCMFIMLNPSTADADLDDPTIRRCIGFAKSWGYGGLHVCNLFAYRATDPRELLKVPNPWGDENRWQIRKHFDSVELIVCAWGNHDIIRKFYKEGEEYDYLDFARRKLHCLRMNQSMVPGHPLYLPKGIDPISFNFQ